MEIRLATNLQINPGGKAIQIMTAIKNVLAATDLSEHSRVAINRAALICQEHGAHLELLHVIEELPPTDLLSPDQCQKIARQHLQDEVERAVPQSIDCRCQVEMGKAFVSVIHSARRLMADLIIIGVHRSPSFRDHFLGTTAEKLIRKSPPPVLIVKQPPQTTYRRVLVPTDFSESSVRALASALILAPQASIELLHVYSYWGEGRLNMAAYSKDVLEQYRREAKNIAKASMDKMLQENGIEGHRVKQHLRQGHAASVIVKFAKELQVDLVVMGTTGRSELRQVLLGSVTEHVLRAVPCDILTGRSPEFQFELP